jgi:hypothetical protein
MGMRAAFNAQVGYRDTFGIADRFVLTEHDSCLVALVPRSTAVAAALHSKQGLTGQGSGAPTQISGCAGRFGLRMHLVATVGVRLDPPVQLTSCDSDEARGRSEHLEFSVHNARFEEPTGATDFLGCLFECYKCALDRGLTGCRLCVAISFRCGMFLVHARINTIPNRSRDM